MASSTVRKREKGKAGKGESGRGERERRSYSSSRLVKRAAGVVLLLPYFPASPPSRFPAFPLSRFYNATPIRSLDCARPRVSAASAIEKRSLGWNAAGWG